MRPDINYLEIQSLTLFVGISAKITVVPPILKNNTLYVLPYNVRWTGAQGNEGLLIGVPGTTPVWTRHGNPALIGQLHRHSELVLLYKSATNTTVQVFPHFAIQNLLYEGGFATPPA